MSKTIIFATSNKGKLSWLERALELVGLPGWTVEVKDIEMIEIQSADLAEISLHKARQAYDLVKKPVLVHDSGFYISELNGFPGPFASYMVQQMPLENFAKLAGTLTDRSCSFQSVATFIEGPEQYHQFHESTRDRFTLTDQIWPEDHPKQWSPLWRILVPSGLGYDIPLAGLSEEAYFGYCDKTNIFDKGESAMMQLAHYLKERETAA